MPSTTVADVLGSPIVREAPTDITGFVEPAPSSCVVGVAVVLDPELTGPDASAPELPAEVVEGVLTVPDDPAPPLPAGVANEVMTVSDVSEPEFPAEVILTVPDVPVPEPPVEVVNGASTFPAVVPAPLPLLAAVVSVLAVLEVVGFDTGTLGTALDAAAPTLDTIESTPLELLVLVAPAAVVEEPLTFPVVFSTPFPPSVAVVPASAVLEVVGMGTGTKGTVLDVAASTLDTIEATSFELLVFVAAA